MDTWSVGSEDYVDVEEVGRAFSRWPKADGVTISGGEPFQQPEALEKLLLLSRKHYSGDILVFSGFEFLDLEKNFSTLISMVDVLVAGPYLAKAGSSLALRGADNQTIHLLSQLGKDRYPSDLKTLKENAKIFDIGLTQNGFSLAGIPGKGAMSALRKNLATRGYVTTTSDQAVDSPF